MNRQALWYVAVGVAKVNDLPGGRVAAGQSLKIPEISGSLPDKVMMRQPGGPAGNATGRSSGRSSIECGPEKPSQPSHGATTFP